MKQKKTALFVGRFQPLHKGHVHAIRQALKKYGRVIVAIGSINRRDKKNPFSFLLRKKMLVQVFGNQIKKNKIRIIGIKDTNDAKWTKKVSRHKFDVVITANARVKKCLKIYAIKMPVFYKRKKYNATRIRSLMRKKRDIKELVPERAYKILKEELGKN